MPHDILIYQITRMNHMITSCVACGQCEDSCPNDIPLLSLYKAIGRDVQAIFDYVPGRDLEETMPLSDFKEDELTPR